MAKGVGFVILNAQFIYNFCTEFKSIKWPLGLIKSTFKKHEPVLHLTKDEKLMKFGYTLTRRRQSSLLLHGQSLGYAS